MRYRGESRDPLCTDSGNFYSRDSGRAQSLLFFLQAQASTSLFPDRIGTYFFCKLGPGRDRFLFSVPEQLHFCTDWCGLRPNFQLLQRARLARRSLLLYRVGPGLNFLYKPGSGPNFQLLYWAAPLNVFVRVEPGRSIKILARVDL